jgi:YHS domain-containing protein
MASRPSTVIDPVCGMAVDVATAEANGFTAEHDGRSYAFCRSRCRQAFLDDPVGYAAKASAAVAIAPAVAAASTGAEMLPVIDEGMRRWYESCSCCLSDATRRSRRGSMRSGPRRPSRRSIRGSASWPRRADDPSGLASPDRARSVRCAALSGVGARRLGCLVGSSSSRNSLTCRRSTSSSSRRASAIGRGRTF